VLLHILVGIILDTKKAAPFPKRPVGDIGTGERRGVGMYVMEAVIRLRNHGYEVKAADGIPGLFNVKGIGRDLTRNQLFDVAERHGSPMMMMPTFPRLDFRS
jgi:hypothetical protein